MSDLFEIRSDTLTATISAHGAELLSITDSAGRQYMTDADPRWWTGHAPILFPIVGRLRDDTLRLDNREYRLEKHGFARRSTFVCEEHDAAQRVRFALEDDAQTRAAFPFAFRLELLFEIQAATLTTTAMVTNCGDQSMPFSFGFHPAFAWPLPGDAAKDAHRVVFAEPEPGPVRRIDTETALLLPEPFATPVDGDSFVPRAELFEADALIWTELRSRACRFGAEGSGALDLAFPYCPQLGVWQKPGAPFLAIEPWAGYNDPVGFDGDFRDKPGVMELAAGSSRSFRLAITVHPPEDTRP